MSKQILVCFKNNEFLSTETSIPKAVEKLLCTYCTHDWRYTFHENENEVKVKVRMIKKHKFPEHRCTNKLSPYGPHRIKYLKMTKD